MDWATCCCPDTELYQGKFVVSEISTCIVYQSQVWGKGQKRRWEVDEMKWGCALGELGKAVCEKVEQEDEVKGPSGGSKSISFSNYVGKHSKL